MRLFEYEGKELLKKAGIRVPEGRIVDGVSDLKTLDNRLWPKMVKSQVLRGGRGKAGLIQTVHDSSELKKAVKTLLGQEHENEEISTLLIERTVEIRQEYYLSIIYQNDSPALVFSTHGGVDVEELSCRKNSGVVVEQIDILNGLDTRQCHNVLSKARVHDSIDELTDLMLKLYKCFYNNDTLICEINPLVLTDEGLFVAVDAKVELDDEALYRQKTLKLPERRDFARKTTELEMLALKNDQMDTRGAAGRMFYEIPGGDIIVLASGGGTSSEALDSLYHHGGHPVVFTEYSGNPTAEKVKGLTKIALQYPGRINGIWVVGGRANFTDIYETLVHGILTGIRETKDFDKRIPIVIRRAGLRDMEAFSALKLIRKNENFNLFLRGMETSISDSAQLLLHHVKNYKKTVRTDSHGNDNQ